jgi:hypothetical protein
MSKPNLRKERFTPHVFKFDPSKAEKGQVVCVKEGPLDTMGGKYATLDDKGNIHLQMRSNDHPGLYLDGVGRVYADLLASAKPDKYRKAAVACINMAILLQDRRAVNMHGFDNSPDEKETPPPGDLEIHLPMEFEQWVDIFDMAFGEN